MRAYILTDLEAEEIREYLRSGESTPHLRVIKGRIKRQLPRVLDDLKLIRRFIESQNWCNDYVKRIIKHLDDYDKANVKFRLVTKPRGEDDGERG